MLKRKHESEWLKKENYMAKQERQGNFDKIEKGKSL